MIRLFNKDETNFDSNGLGVLDPAIKENVVEEKMNGIYNFDFAYLSKGKHASQLEGDMIIKVPTPDGDQLFRVYKVTKNIGFLEVNCYHIFYDLAGNFIEDINIVRQSGQAAITHFGAGLQYATRFKFVSNIAGTNSARMVRLNAIQALLDSSQDNSFLSRWGGEIKRDNFTVYMNDVRGNDKGFKIRHGKNLTGYEANIDHSTVVTRIMPYGYNGLMLPEKYVDSPLRDKYAFTRIKKIEYTDIKAIDPDASSNDESSVPLEEAYELLRQAAALEYSVNKVDIPTSNFKVTFDNLADTKEYADFKALEKVEPWDYVTVIADNLDIKSRMISYKYDAITQAYKEVELGNYVPSFSDTNTETNNKLSNINNDLNNINNDLNTVAESANGKNSNYYGSAEPSHPVDGDLWYKKNGDKTELWQYDGKSVPPGWKLIVDDATGEEVRQNVDNAMEEAEEAKVQANDAVGKANQAVADAGFANDTATQAKSDAAAAGQQAKDALTNAGTALTNAKTALDNVTKLDQTVKTEVTSINGQLAQKVSQTTFDTLKGTVTSQQTEINQNASGIKLKADQSYADTINNSVVKNTSSVGLLNDQIALTVSKTELTSKLNGYATQTWSESKISAAKNEISASVQNMTSDMATQTWTQGKLDLTAEGFTSQISSVQTNLDSLSFGYRNLIPNGSFNDGLNGWTVSLQPGEASNVISLAGNETLNGNHFIFMDGNNSASTTYVGDIASNKAIPLEPSTEYSLRIITRSMVTNYLSFFEEKDKNGNVINDHAFMVNQTDASKYSENIQHFTTSATANYGNFRLRLYPGDQFVAGEIFLVQGNRLPKDWVSAPDDQATVAQFTSIEQTLKGVQVTANNAVTQSQYTQLAGQFTSTIAAVSSGNLVADSGWTGVTGVTTHAFYTGTAQLYYIDNSSKTAENYGYSPYFAVKPNTKYTLSFKAFTDNKVTNSDVFLLTRSSGSAEGFDTAHLIIGSRKFSGSTSEYVTAQVTTGASDNEGYIRFDNNGSTDGTLSRLYFTEVQLEEGSTATPYKLSVSAAQSQITQLQSDVNLRVQKGDVINQINISPESILIAGQKVHITGQTSIDNAVIKDAMIANVTADKITAGTLNAANVNVINLNANNITTGTIKGANLSLNLNTGEVVFQHGRIHSTSNNVDVNIDQGYLSTASSNTRVMLKEGQLQLVQPTIFDNSKDPYLQISNSIGGASFNGANIIARDYLVLANRANSDGFFDAPLDEPETFAGLAVGKTSAGRWKPTRIGGAERGIIMRGGTAYKIDSSFMYKESPEIFVGTDGAGLKPSDRIYINGSYVHITSAYWRTASGSANLMVARDGALVRSTSASKYKTDIIRTNIPDYGEKLLNLPTATWTDIAETKRFRDDPINQPKPTRNFGMIAEDLADAGLEMLVVRGADGELEGINYDRIGPALIPVIAKLKNKIEKLEQKLEEPA